MCVRGGRGEPQLGTPRPREAQGESRAPPGGPGRQHGARRSRWALADADTYPVLVVDDLHEAAVLRLDGRRRHGLLGLGRLGGLLLQLLLREGARGGERAGGRAEGEAGGGAAWAGGRAQEVRLLTISSESPAGTPSPGGAPQQPAGDGSVQPRPSSSLRALQPAGPGSHPPPWGLGSELSISKQLPPAAPRFSLL